MNEYLLEIELYFDLKGTPESSRESYYRRIVAFLNYVQDKDSCLDSITEKDIQQYILYLKKEKGLSAGTINNYISSIQIGRAHV